MNKKILFGMFAAASMLLATSCTSEDLDGAQAQSGKEATVSFTLGVENGAQTRAISDGTGATELHYTVFDNKGGIVYNKAVKNVESYPTTVEVTLAKGKTYQVAFWAQNPNCEAYEVSNDMNVTVDYAGLNNDETLDAFCMTTNAFTVTGDATQNVVLRRPFAQLNVGITEEAWTAAVNAGVTVAQSSAAFTNAATKLNVLTGAVEGSTTVAVAYDLSDVPTEALKANNAEYIYLSMCYLLVNADGNGTGKDAINDVDFTFTTADGNYGVDLNRKDGLATVPVQRNWRTNILLEKFLTGDITFNITLDKNYINDENHWGTLVPEEEPAVDPSEEGLSVEWALMNVGANSPEELGTFYGWGGNIDGLTKVDANGVSTNTWETYEWFKDTDGTNTAYAEEMTKYNPTDALTTLLAADDIAATMGEGWRTPTKEEMMELLNECTWTWNAEKKGYDVVENVVNGQAIFLPAGGYREVRNRDWGTNGTTCCYWTATLTDSWTKAYALEAAETETSEFEHKWLEQYERCWASLIRPVRAK